MTKGAQEFITPMTLQALSGNPVHTDLLDPEAEAAMGHIELARWADLLLVAPATANFIASLTAGMGNDLLSTLCLANRSKIAIAPAMNQAMWADQATQDNIATLAARDVAILGPASGGQACGDVGLGRMLEPIEIAQAAAELFDSQLLAGKSVVITAGPTREAIDPVRYISNHSSGKMGYALAHAVAEAGASVTLISGPVSLSAPAHVNCVRVESALEMHEAAMTVGESADIFIGAAAVADFRPNTVHENKLKKGRDNTMTIELVKNPDIIADVAARDNAPFMVGFAAETQNVEAYAKRKLDTKKLNLIIANDVSNTAIGFNSDNNAVVVYGKTHAQSFGERSKTQLARDLVRYIAECYEA